jgi:hypothetical protein
LIDDRTRTAVESQLIEQALYGGYGVAAITQGMPGNSPPTWPEV